MRRIGELIPDAARALGLEDELRLARAIATFESIVAERVPVLDDDTVETLRARVQAVEHRLLPQTVKELIS